MGGTACARHSSVEAADFSISDELEFKLRLLGLGSGSVLGDDGCDILPLIHLPHRETFVPRRVGVGHVGDYLAHLIIAYNLNALRVAAWKWFESYAC